MLFRIFAMSLVALLLPAGSVLAQEASVAGRVVDESGAVLPGVTVTATNLDTSQQHVAVTAARGDYRLRALPPGRYSLRAELPGFASVVVPEVELLVGQNATVPFTLQVAGVEETVTVSGDAPLVDLRSSQVSGNVDRRQMEELPINGRNWMELTLYVKGITANTVGSRPGVAEDREFQLNLDGQQITNKRCCSGGFDNPKLSREAIAEYQVVTNLFDVTMGHSIGIQVQAISKSGTNNFNGSAYGFFRDDRFNAADPFTGEVLPFSNQQVGGSLGGPILRDKTFFFGSYEYERQPDTVVISPSAWDGQILTLPETETTNNVLARVDHQITARDRLSVRGLFWRRFMPADWSSGSHPARAAKRVRQSIGLTGSWVRPIGDDRLLEVEGGYFEYHYANFVAEGAPVTTEYRFPGARFGSAWNYPNPTDSPTANITSTFTWNMGGHELKIGGEYRGGTDNQFWPARARGIMRFTERPDDFARRFPLEAWNDPSQWDFSGLDSIGRRFDIAYSNDFNNWFPRPTWSAWIGDTWRATDQLTLNLGVRYDLPWGDLAPPGVRETDVIIDNGLFTENVGFRNDIRDVNNVAPRFGFTWDPTGTGDFVIRGGSGLFYGMVTSVEAANQQKRNGQREIEMSFVNDGQPGWVEDPTRGVTADDVLSGRVPIQKQVVAPIAHDFEIPYTWQSIIGFQKQLSPVMGVDADVVYWRGYNINHQFGPRDANLLYDPATGFPFDPNRVGRPNPEFETIELRESIGRMEYLALPASFTRRYGDNFQAQVTYTLMFIKDDRAPYENPFDPTSGDGRADDFQRHTVRLNGIYSLPWGVTVAGSYRYGSGGYATINAGVDPRGIGSSRIRNDLSLVPRNTFKDDPFQSLDLRVSKTFRLPNSVEVTGIAELFNVYNYARYSYNLIEGSPRFGDRRGSAGDPRQGQLAVRIEW